MFLNAGASHGPFNLFLSATLAHVIPSLNPTVRGHADMDGREQVLPSQCRGCIMIFPLEGIENMDLLLAIR